MRCAGLGLDRRAALWQVRGLQPRAALPLFANLPVAVRPAALAAMSKAEQVIADYQTTGLSLKATRYGSCARALPAKA